MPNLTKSRIERLAYSKDGPSRQALFDSRLPGFGVRVYPSGRKSYILNYGPTERRRMMVLGPATTGADVEEMREHAQGLLRRYERDQIDPLDEQKRRTVSTVSDVVSKYIDAREPSWAPREAKRCRSRLKNHIGVKLSTLPLNRLTRAQVRNMHERVSRSAPYEANRTVQLLRAAINWAISDLDWPLTDLTGGENPAARVRLNQEQRRKEWIKPAEIPAVIAAVRAEENVWIRHYFLMMFYTGARKSELLGLRWEDVDLDGGTLTFRDTKNKTDHTLQLAQDAIEILEATSKTRGNSYVFNGQKRGQPLTNPYKAWARILKRAGIDRKLNIHDVRRTVGSLLASSGRSTQQIGKLLNHKSEITAKVYAEIADESKAEMADAIAAMIRPKER